MAKRADADADAGAGVQKPGRLRRWLNGLSRPQGVRLDRRGSLRARIDDYSEALALAEAGELLLADTAVSIRNAGKKRIIVLGHGPDYLGRLAEYALHLAQRLGYGLVFLNVGETTPPSQASAEMQRHLRENFAAKSAEAARPWLVEALNMGVEAGHLVWFGDPAKAVEEVCAQLHRVELILSGPSEVDDIRDKAPSAVFAVE